MPRKRRAGIGRLNALTENQRFELLIGTNGVSAFTSERERRAAWAIHRDELMALVNPGTRPEGWWLYEAKSGIRPGETDAAALARLGVLAEVG